MIFTARLRQARTSKPVVVAALVATLLLACALPLAAQAKQSDRSQPIDVHAQHFDALAKPNGVSHLKGNVTITQGTLKITSATATVYFDANSRVSRVVLTGNPAHLRQTDDHGNLVLGHANTIDYNISKGIATLSGAAHIKQAGRGQANGDTLIYNTTTSAMTGQSHGDHRVHLIFQPREATSTQPTPAPASTTGGH